MKKNIKKLIAFVLTMIIALNVPVPTQKAEAAGSAASVGALLDSYAASNGETYTLSADSRVFVVADSEPTGELLQTAQLIQRQLAAKNLPATTPLSMVWGPSSYAKTGDLVLSLDTASGIDADGYQLNVGDTAMVAASDVDGLLYGANMLMKCMINSGSTSLSGFTASDAPDTKERTVMLDTGRKYYTVEWICNFIRQMSWMGYNAIEIHFSEDGGFRADLWDPAYYTEGFSPENDFTWLCGSHVQSWVKDGNKNDINYDYRTDPNANKYLTTAELVEICKVAKEYHMEVIPSFDSPAHMDYITWKFEQNYKSNTSYSFTYKGTPYKASDTGGCINYTGKTGASSPVWPYYTTIDITAGTMAKAFVFALYEDMADFFKVYAGSTNFSIGADEVNLSSDYSPKWSYSAFPGYINELNQMLNAKGYTCRMFNDFIGSTTYNQSNSKAVYEFDDNIEIMYWNSDFNPTTGKWTEPIWHVKFFWENNTGSTDNWGDGGRIMYNCIQTNCYYVLRVANALSSENSNYMKDARNPENTNWTFYHSTEENIYNEWYPADISEKGLYTEDAADVPADQLGGAYFLIWNDYAALNTEAEVWNDVKDNTGTSSYVYSLFDRMWSNTIKMWNSDINSSVAYSNFAAVRDTFGYFPGFTDCSADAVLPAATAPTQAYLADHSALTEALADKVSNDDGAYTADSYAAYEAAYEAAVSVNSDHGATAEAIQEAITNLSNAKAALTKVEEPTEESTEETTEEEPTEESTEETAEEETTEEETTEEETEPVVPVDGLAVEFRTTVNGAEHLIKTEYFALTDTGVYSHYIAPVTGYKFLSAEGTVFTGIASNDGSGFIYGKATEKTTVILRYESVPDTGRLEYLIRNAIEKQNSITADSWNVYQSALTEGKNFTLSTSTIQSVIEAMIKVIEESQSKLVMASDETKIISIVRLSEPARLGKQVGLKITTSPNVETLSIEGETLTVCTGRVQTLKTGETVKIWLVYFPADRAGSFTYTLNAGAVTETFDITVK